MKNKGESRVRSGRSALKFGEVAKYEYLLSV